MSRLSLYLLGPPCIERDGEPIKVDTRKAIALLAYVAITGERHGRDALVNLLWPEYDHTRGRAALRSTLYALRKALTGDWLDVDRESVGLNPRATPSTGPRTQGSEQELWLDVDQFHEHLAQCHTHGHSPSDVCPACLVPLTNAVALYRNDFMSGFSLKDSLNFDDWQFFQTDALCREFASALERLIRCHIAQGTFEPAIRYARRWLALDRLAEEAHYRLMQLYAWSGQRSAALRQYQECAKILESQLGVSPQAPTIALYQAIQEGRVSQPPGQVLPLDEQREHETRPVHKGPQVVEDEKKRMLTALFVDASGSFDKEFDPEDQARSMGYFLQAMTKAVSEHGGQIERTLGGSVLAVFGTSQTRESDPELAIRAAIEARQEAQKLGLSTSIGVSTGKVYLRKADAAHDGAPALADITLLGAAVDHAVHLAGQAQAGQILVGESTHRLTRRAFEFTPLVLEVKGIKDAAMAYRVERLLLQPQKPRGIEGLRAELVGRDEELTKLKGALAQVLEGRGHMASLIGEAGVGKSRLVAEIKEVALTPAGPMPLWLEGRCLEVGTAASYVPFVDIFRQYFAWGAREADRRRYERITSCLQEMAKRKDLYQERTEEMAALLANLLSLRTGDEWAERLQRKDPEQIRRGTFIAVHDFFLALARQRPVVLVFEDLHWADSLSIDLISLLMEGLALGPILLLCVYRPEREHKCRHLGTIAAQKCRGRYTELHLRELTRQQSQRLVESLLGIEDLSASTRDLILKRCQGNPFFIEEAVHSLIDAGIVYRQGDVWRAREEIVSIAVPESVQSVILSRVDRLDDDLQHVLQIASAIGRVFRRRVLERTIQQEIELEWALWGLEDRALVYQERTIPEVEYSFKHVLTQETIYQSILRDRRKEFHHRIANAIEILYQDSLDEHYEQLAHHHERSGNVQEAILYLLKAGEKATRSYANEEAVAHLTRGLELLETIPETPERARRELDVQIALGIPLYHIQGQSAPRVGRAYKRALELCEQVDDVQQRFRALIGLRRFHFVRGELQVAHELAEQILALAQRAGDPLLLSFSHLAMGATLYWLGEFSQARAHCEQGTTLHSSQRRRSHVFLYGIDVGIGSRLYTALALWHLGYPDQALETGRGALVQARELSHLMTLVYAHHLAGILHQSCREVQTVQELAETMFHISTEREFAFYSTAGITLRGWALAEQGRAAEGIGQIREGIAAWQAIEASVMLPYSLAYLAEAYKKVGKVQEGLNALAEALMAVGVTGCRTWEAELHRLRGELLLIKDAEAQAETCFEQAIDIARRQSAKSWELRAATSLGRLWYKQGKTRQARELLEEIYDWFTEGFDTADLREARALLDTLV